jgi:hypothetical protein
LEGWRLAGCGIKTNGIRGEMLAASSFEWRNGLVAAEGGVNYSTQRRRGAETQRTAARDFPTLGTRIVRIKPMKRIAL